MDAHDHQHAARLLPNQGTRRLNTRASREVRSATSNHRREGYTNVPSDRSQAEGTFKPSEGIPSYSQDVEPRQHHINSSDALTLGSSELQVQQRHSNNEEVAALDVERTDIPRAAARQSPSNALSKRDRLSVLTARVNQLHTEQDVHGKHVQELKKRIHDSELACGRMAQQLLQTQQALEMRRKHITQDQERMSLEEQSRERKMQEILSAVSQIQELAQDMSDPGHGS